MLSTIYIIAITAEAMTGALAAGRRNMDLFGVMVIAFLTALGGGTVRDIVLGHYPIGWTQHPEYIWLVLSAGLFTVLIARFMHRFGKIFLILDAFGLIAFTLIGCEVALTMGYHPTVVVMAGMTTGIAGGVLRDILCSRVPVVFRHELYASVALLVALSYLGLGRLGVQHDVNVLMSFALGLVIRLFAIYRGWRLPVFSYRQPID
ncbi:trimeric intracellular cation channel family protein [Jeongeupia naejangsanensis]|uniref:Trimeric intracellular cation channel family protein n=1 Tax=Jeongeupia naejangsanensis TaxID=613195 RepID=A0ABS2BQ61_9NEIS|nr:trimeric intracellular cation channel family protein [Jeongeupia naejangsanensis]MBM3117173.1 trimeric intracellular cation channel family protein [Jeongeupia naejangsanensis]